MAKKPSKKSDNTVRGITRDPTLEQVLMLIRNSDKSIAWISDKSGVSKTTLYNWDRGRTRRPQNVTMDFVLRTIGYKRTITRL